MSTEIRRRTTAYEAAKQKALSSLEPDDTLFWTCVAATSAWRNPFGRWHDPELDEQVRVAASALEIRAPKLETQRGKLAHITSTIADGGGHMETLLGWCANVGGEVISSQWEESEHLSDAGLQQLKARSYLCGAGLRPTEKATWIVERLVALRPEKILLHINPNDVIALTAAVKYRDLTGAQIIFYDHVDSLYWLGARLVDRVIELRPAGAVIARDFREIPESKISHVPLTSRLRQSPPVSRGLLDLPENCSVSLTVAAYYKVRSDGHWDFGHTLNSILDKNPKHYHLIVGHGNAEDEKQLRAALTHRRVRFLGRRTDIDSLLRISDFVIESFPLMGGLFRLDVMQQGVPLVAISHRQWPQVFDMGVFPTDYSLVATTNADVVRLSQMLIDDSGLRNTIGTRLREHYERHFSPAAINAAMKDALHGIAMAVPASSAEVDQEWFALVLNPVRSDSQTIINWVAASLSYTPRLSFGERLNYWKSYIESAVAARFKQPQQPNK